MIKDITILYNRYNEVLRPLVSEIEGRNEFFEEPLLFNVASMFDNLALFGLDNIEEENSLRYFEKAEYYLDLSISQSYQYLIKNLDEKMNIFEKKCNNLDLGLIDGGKFIKKYNSLKEEAKMSVRNGRCKDDSLALKDYCCAYKAYSDIEKLIDGILPTQIMFNTRKKSFILTILGWGISILISILVGKFVFVYSDTLKNLLGL